MADLDLMARLNLLEPFRNFLFSIEDKQVNGQTIS